MSAGNKGAGLGAGAGAIAAGEGAAEGAEAAGVAGTMDPAAAEPAAAVADPAAEGAAAAAVPETVPAAVPALVPAACVPATGEGGAPDRAEASITWTRTMLTSVARLTGFCRWKRNRYSPVPSGFMANTAALSSYRRVSYRIPSRPSSSPRYIQPEPGNLSSKRAPFAASSLVSATGDGAVASRERAEDVGVAGKAGEGAGAAGAGFGSVLGAVAAGVVAFAAGAAAGLGVAAGGTLAATGGTGLGAGAVVAGTGFDTGAAIEGRAAGGMPGSGKGAGTAVAGEREESTVISVGIEDARCTCGATGSARSTPTLDSAGDCLCPAIAAGFSTSDPGSTGELAAALAAASAPSAGSGSETQPEAKRSNTAITTKAAAGSRFGVSVDRAIHDFKLSLPAQDQAGDIDLGKVGTERGRIGLSIP